MQYHRYHLSGLLLLSSFAYAGEDPISWEIVSDPLPLQSSLYSIYHTTYRLTSELPFTMPTPLMIDIDTSTDEFISADSCSQLYLQPGESCNVVVTLNPNQHGYKTAGLTLIYGDTKIPLPVLETQTLQASESWSGLIGVDYNPNHYASDISLSFHDVYYVGTTPQNTPMTNVYAELAQLQAAGFNTVRSYQTIEYSWIDIILQANALNMNVVYEAVIPQGNDTSDITAAVSVLSNVIDVVGSTVFQDTVTLVFAGHENYCDTCNSGSSNIAYLTQAVSALQTELSNNNITTPVGSALLSESLATPSSISDMQTLINSYSANAPLAMDPYPFQWGVPLAQAVTSASTQFSIAWNYAQIMSQSFYVNPRSILMAETGWATQGTNTSYYCYLNPTTNPCMPGVSNAASYFSALYAYVRDTSHLSGALAFYAYDEPAAAPDPTDAENFYGVFDSNCNLKNNDLNLLPNTAYSPAAHNGCQGFVQGALFVAVGDPSAQPPFTVAITQQNPTTLQNIATNVTVPTQDRSNIDIYPWPNFLVFNNAAITLTGSSGAVCTGNATVSGAPPVLSLPAQLVCTDSVVVNCSGVNCYLPNNF